MNKIKQVSIHKLIISPVIIIADLLTKTLKIVNKKGSSVHQLVIKNVKQKQVKDKHPVKHYV